MRSPFKDSRNWRRNGVRCLQDSDGILKDQAPHALHLPLGSAVAEREAFTLLVVCVIGFNRAAASASSSLAPALGCTLGLWPSRSRQADARRPRPTGHRSLILLAPHPSKDMLSRKRCLRIRPDMSPFERDRGDAGRRHLGEVLAVPEETRAAWLSALRERNPSLAAEIATALLEHRALIEQRFPEPGTTADTTSDPTRSVPGIPVAVARSRSFEDDFPGTDRFTVIRRLGAGGMGVVYEVEDRMRHEVVALKTLRHTTPAGIYRLKREFRSLAGITNPNIVCLYELFVEDARCFFTMELVQGVSFVDYAREGPKGPVSIVQLTSALQQLINGVSALHQMGKLHRDIKPSNVLVTPQGRVVILDFGLIAELFPDRLWGSEPIVGGTPAYLPPE